MIDNSSVGDLIFLGTGTSHGVPMIGCECDVCQSLNPKNNRTRTSAILGFPQGNLLIDTAPEMRIQFTREKIRYAHAILYTHHHVDHFFGLDDTRRFQHLNGGLPTPVYCSEQVEHEIHIRFSYIFDPIVKKFPAGGVPKLEIHRISPYEEFEVLGRKVLPLAIDHGIFHILGYRIGDLAYCTDVKHFPDATLERLQGLETLIIGCLRYDPHPAHMGLQEVLDVVDILKPKRTFFIHTTHNFDYDQLNSQLPPNIRLAYDGLHLEHCF